MDTILEQIEALSFVERHQLVLKLVEPYGVPGDEAALHCCEHCGELECEKMGSGCDMICFCDKCDHATLTRCPPCFAKDKVCDGCKAKA